MNIQRGCFYFVYQSPASTLHQPNIVLPPTNPTHNEQWEAKLWWKDTENDDEILDCSYVDLEELKTIFIYAASHYLPQWSLC